MDKENIIDKYTVTGVPSTSLPEMCKELNINEEALMDFLCGQTMGYIGGVTLIYPWDLKRFINGLPNID
jgi:hypothetical protein